MMYVGVDVGKSKCRAAMMSPEGRIIRELNLSNDREGITCLASLLTMDDRVVMESTGAYWLDLYTELEDMHIPVVLANPLKTKAIASARIKSDKVDARILAHLLRTNLIPECYVPPKEMREIRSMVRHRLSIVKLRSTVKNRIHSLVDRKGLKHEFSDLFGKSGIQWLKSLELSSLDRLMLDNYLMHLENLDAQVSRVDLEITRRASLDEDVRLLLSLTGVNVYTALLIKSEIGTIERFPNYKRLVSWAGLAPSLHQSGDFEYHGSITKQGSTMLRWIMVESARVASVHDPRLRAFYERVRERRGDQKAIVAVANKMLKIIWFMLTKREEYESANKKRYAKKLNSLND
ncbi:MAG: IS110 family transposase [Candidatus Bathyarchaeota archaeon]|nr:IS110 family transposase [Candidatus Bathyarchaeota archaeon]